MVNVSLRKRRREHESNDENDSSQEYQVEAIVDKRIRGKKTQYLLKWQGYSSSDNTWEDVNRLNCPELIKKFEDNLKSKNNPRKLTLRKRSSSLSKSKDTSTYETDEDYQSVDDESMDTENDNESTQDDENTRMATRQSPRKKINNSSSSVSIRRHSDRKAVNQTKSRITTMSKDESSDDNDNDDVIEEIPSPTKHTNKTLSSTPKQKKTTNENSLLLLDNNKNLISPQKTPTKDSSFNEPTTINLCLHISPSSSSSISFKVNDNDKNVNNNHTSEHDTDETDQVERIESVRHNQDGISFRIKLINENRSQWIPAKIANRKYPQAVITFWENHVQFI